MFYRHRGIERTQHLLFQQGILQVTKEGLHIAIFQKSENTQAYLKDGLMGFAGDSKTYTTSSLAIGKVKFIHSNGSIGKRPGYGDVLMSSGEEMTSFSCHHS